MLPLVASALRLGSSSPDALVVLFHGLTGDRSSLKSLAEAWAAERPGAQFVLMQAMESSSRGGFDWFPFPKRRDECASEAAFVSDVVLPSLLRCRADVSDALDELMAELRLKEDRVVLAGFSQGAAVAAYTGLARGVAGVLPMGGPCPPREQLLPDPATTPTKVCIISGELDGSAPAAELEAAFSNYSGRVHILPGVRHSIASDHLTIGADFLAEVLK